MALSEPTDEGRRRRGTSLRRDELQFLPAALEVVETPASPIGRAIAATIIAFLVTAIAWAYFGRIDIIATAEGRIIPAGKTKTIQPFETGVVQAIHVADGQSVKIGDILIEIDATANEADEKRLAHDLMQDRLDSARLHALLSGNTDAFAPPAGAEASAVETSRHQMESQAAEQSAKLAVIERQVAQKEAERSSVAATIKKIETVLPILRELRDIRQRLLQNEYGSRLLYLQAEQQVVEQEQTLAVENHHLGEAEEALATLDRQRQQTEAEYRRSLLTDLAKAETQASEHAEEVTKATQKRLLQTLKAPVDGTVQQLAVHTIGGVVTPAEQLMVIVPANAGLEIEANLANKDIGFVHAGQSVEIKVETFNFTRYGLLHGTVRDVSRDAVAPESSQRNPLSGDASPSAASDEQRQAQQPTYVAHVNLTETGIQTELGWTKIEPGMAVTTEIKTGDRRVIEYLMSPLMRLRQEGLRER